MNIIMASTISPKQILLSLFPYAPYVQFPLYQWYQSMVLTMYTHVKTNAKFHNYVNEALALYESCFDQINLAL